MSVPELGSIEFYNTYYRDSAEGTKAIIGRLISSLESYLSKPGNTIDGWLAEKKGNAIRWKERFLFLRKFNDVYWHFDVAKYNPDYLKIVEDMNMGRNLTVKSSNSNENLWKEFERLDKLREDVLRGPVTLETLFGFWLPPRRMDVYELEIRSSDTDEPINYYNKNYNKFVFNDYKNGKSKGKQEFSILGLMPLYQKKEILSKAISFLNSRRDGKLYPWATFNRKIPEWYGTDNNTLRKYWESMIDRHGTKEQRLILSKWLDHSVDTAVKNYVIDKPSEKLEEKPSSKSMSLRGALRREKVYRDRMARDLDKAKKERDENEKKQVVGNMRGIPVEAKVTRRPPQFVNPLYPFAVPLDFSKVTLADINMMDAKKRNPDYADLSKVTLADIQKMERRRDPDYVDLSKVNHSDFVNQPVANTGLVKTSGLTLDDFAGL